MWYMQQGPEIRTGFLKNPDVPLTFTAGKTIKITTDYDHKGDEEMISMRCSHVPLIGDLECSWRHTHAAHRLDSQFQRPLPPCLLLAEWLLRLATSVLTSRPLKARA